MTRYSYHLHSLSGLWYVFDHMHQGACSVGYQRPSEALAEARRLDAVWARECRERRRQESRAS